MRSNPSNTDSLGLHSPLESLALSKKPSAHLLALQSAGMRSLEDLLWALPLRALPLPPVAPFYQLRLGELFLGQGRIIHREIRPAFGRRTKGKFLLYNAYLVVQELSGMGTMSLRWFNVYPNQKKQMELWDRVWFLGTAQEWRGQVQLVNPKVHPLADDDWSKELGEWLIEYPTINKVPGNFTAGLINRLPSNFWRDIKSPYGTDDLTSIPLTQAFQVLHARLPAKEVSENLRLQAEERLAYEEFFVDQLKIATRRRYIKKKAGAHVPEDPQAQQAFRKLLPFDLTDDQLKAVDDVLADMRSGHPMMRMVQGDVGCGKTVVAMLAALSVLQAGFQVAIMCPTEALARQHAETLGLYFGKLSFLKPTLLLGSMKKKERDLVHRAIANAEANFVIGTHSLFQEGVSFSKLGLAIIDEQHKFGVEQRLQLMAKGQGTHCLIMSATPIPRTLSLAQYGDLDFTTIKVMPAGRKGIKSRIVDPVNYDKYIDFIHQRLAMGEQGYFVFPAIEESETQDLQNVKAAFDTYVKTFPNVKIAMLHGKMKADEKEATVKDFTAGKIAILISTTVIEVGINVPNASFMCIYHPERFGLSSLHQLRGRVGRGQKPGFCFLVLDSELTPTAHARLEILEKTADGFVIAEADLQNRGEGDLFGVDQSGVVTRRRVADFHKHSKILEKVYQDVQQLMRNHPEKIDPILLGLARDQKILDTI